MDTHALDRQLIPSVSGRRKRLETLVTPLIGDDTPNGMSVTCTHGPQWDRRNPQHDLDSSPIWDERL